MREARPEFDRPKMGRKGYSATEVDSFVDKVLDRVNRDRSHDGMSAGEIGIMFFTEERGSSAYDSAQVDEWLARMKDRVAEVEERLHENDLPEEREGSIVDMPAAPHFADRFPRVSRAVLGFSVPEVDDAMERLRAELAGPTPPTGHQILGLAFSEEPGGYRQAAVAQSLEMIAIARDL